MLVDLWLPEGSTHPAERSGGQALRGAPDAASPAWRRVTTWVGSGVPRFYLPLDQIFPQTNVSQVIVLPKDLAAREALRKRLPALLADEFPEVRGRVKLLPNGPPVPYPVQFRVVGHRRGAGARSGPTRPRTCCAPTPACAASTTTGTSRSRCCAWRSTRTRRARWASPARRSRRPRAPCCRARTIGQYREGDKLIDIVLRQPLDERNAITDLGNAYLPTASGRSGAADADRQGRASAGSRACCGARAATTPSRCRATSSTACRAPTVTAQIWPQLQELAAQHAAGLPHRGGRRGGGKQQGPGLDRRRRAADAVHHLHAADAAAAELQPRDAGVPDRAAGHCRRGRARCCCWTGRSASWRCWA